MQKKNFSYFFNKDCQFFFFSFWIQGLLISVTYLKLPLSSPNAKVQSFASTKSDLNFQRLSLTLVLSWHKMRPLLSQVRLLLSEQDNKKEYGIIYGHGGKFVDVVEKDMNILFLWVHFATSFFSFFERLTNTVQTSDLLILCDIFIWVHLGRAGCEPGSCCSVSDHTNYYMSALQTYIVSLFEQFKLVLSNSNH